MCPALLVGVGEACSRGIWHRHGQVHAYGGVCEGDVNTVGVLECAWAREAFLGCVCTMEVTFVHVALFAGSWSFRARQFLVWLWFAQVCVRVYTCNLNAGAESPGSHWLAGKPTNGAIGMGWCQRVRFCVRNLQL